MSLQVYEIDCPNCSIWESFLHVAPKYLRFLSLVHLWHLKASSQVLSLQHETPWNCTDKEGEEKKKLKRVKSKQTTRRHSSTEKAGSMTAVRSVESHGTHRCQKKNKGLHVVFTWPSKGSLQRNWKKHFKQHLPPRLTLWKRRRGREE